jgi:dihydrolipoamide dehydrogenase
MTTPPFDLVVVGAGPTGYVASIRAAQLGMKVACVERERPGGICLNWGCIPSKALLKSAEVLDLCRHAKDYGVVQEGAPRPDLNAMIERSRRIVDRLAKGIEHLLRKNKVEHVKGRAVLGKGGGPGSRSVQVELQEGGGRELKAKHVLLATGGRARLLPGLEPDGKKVFTYREAMLLDRLPDRAIVIGGGAIGVELGWFWSTLGSKVTIVEMLPRILPVEDEEVSKAVERSLAKRGLEILTDTAYQSAKMTSQGIDVTVKPKTGDPRVISGDMVLVAIGVRANVEGIGLEEAGVELERGFVKTREGFETSAPSVYAAGDLIGGMLLAHKGSAEGIACVERLAGKGEGRVDYRAIPGGTFCQPQVGSIGLTEAQAREKGHDVRVGRFPFSALGRAIAVGEEEGFVKVVIDAKHGEILGAHVVHAHAADLIAEIGVAMTSEATAHEIARTVHSHPTLPEAVAEATLDALGEAIHI